MSEQIEFIVVIGETGRHAIWPAANPLPWGWSPEGFVGPRAACLAHIAEVWRALDPIMSGQGAS